MKNRKILTLVIVGLLVVACISIVVIRGNNNRNININAANDQNISIPDSGSGEALLELNKEYFVSNKLGFKIRLPVGWTLDSEDGTGVVFYNDNFGSLANFSIVKTVWSVGLDQYVGHEKLVISSSTLTKNSVLVLDYVVDNIPAYRIYWDSLSPKQDDGTWVSNSKIVLKKDGYVYDMTSNVSMTLPEYNDSAIESAMDTMIIF